jgi:hypothetical protein
VPKPQKHDFSLNLTRVIEPKEGPGVELATLEDAARFMGHMRPWRQTRPHWDYAAALVLKAQQSIPSALGRVPLAARCPIAGGIFPQRRRHLPQGNVDKTETMPHGYPDWGQHTGNG